MLYFTGDIHGNPFRRLSFKNNPKLRELTENDIMIILGDGGIPFGIEAPGYDYKDDQNKFDWLDHQKYQTIIIAGNHDDRDAIALMPTVEKWGGTVRKALLNGQVYHKIYYVDTPQILDLCGSHCLLIPGAESHDIRDGVLNPEDPEFHYKYRNMMLDPYSMFRVKHWSWWEDEAVDVAASKTLLAAHDEYFDYILTHDAPACLFDWYGTFWTDFKPTEGEIYLEEVRQSVVFDTWLHGHFHENMQYPQRVDDRVFCLYEFIVDEQVKMVEPDNKDGLRTLTDIFFL